MNGQTSVGLGERDSVVRQVSVPGPRLMSYSVGVRVGLEMRQAVTEMVLDLTDYAVGLHA